MKRAVIFFLSASALFLGLGAGLPATEPQAGGGGKTLKPVLEFNIGMPNEQCRFVPFSVKGERCFLTVHSKCVNIDPFHRMFFFPTDTLKLTAFDAHGKRLWHRDLGGGVIPGVHFCPVTPFDVDGDGTDEIFLVDNSDPDHPLNHEKYVLRWYGGADGKQAGQIKWPAVEKKQEMSHLFRNFIMTGHSKGRPRLVTAQGTYEKLQLQGWDEKLKPLWTSVVGKDDPGPRGSHMSPVIDLDGDGRDEILYGERCFDIDTGQQLWVIDDPKWNGHSDVVQPTWDREKKEWLIYTCRESGSSERGVVMLDARGRERWGHRGLGHMDMGWAAHLGEGGAIGCYAMQIDTKSAGPAGFKRTGLVPFFWDQQGNPLKIEFPLNETLPVDFDGDGIHELVYSGGGEQPGVVIDRHGARVARLTGKRVANAGKLLDLPGEQIVTTDPGGTVRIFALPGAVDTPVAKARYAHPYYQSCIRHWAGAGSRCNLGGL